jgi:hypothetical protein
MATKKRRSKPGNGETELYRHFNSDDVLLYVGITGEPVMRRVQGHRGRSSWFREISYIKLEHFQTRALAEIAEQIAILVERPLYNTRRDSNLARRHVDDETYVCAQDYRHLLRSRLDELDRLEAEKKQKRAA